MNLRELHHQITIETVPGRTSLNQTSVDAGKEGE